MQLVKIEPVNVLGGSADVVQVGDFSVNPYKSASANLTLGTMIDQTFAPSINTRAFNSAMTPEQYAQWGENDDYAINCVIVNAGLTPVK